MTPRIILIAQNVSLWDDTYESFGIVASPYSALTLYCHSNDYLIRERCQSSDTNPHWGICRSTQPHISKFLLDTTQGHLLQTQDHPNNFPSSFWGSFTSEPITSPTIPSAENQSSFLLVPVTSSSQFQVLNGSDSVPALTLSPPCCHCCHHPSWHTPLLSEWQQEPPGEPLCPGFSPLQYSFHSLASTIFPKTELKVPFPSPNTWTVP